MNLQEEALCNYLGVINHNPKYFTGSFPISITKPSIIHCGVDSAAKWTRSLCKDNYLEMYKTEFKRTAKVWQNFVQARILPSEHTSHESKVCLIYFLLRGDLSTLFS